MVTRGISVWFCAFLLTSNVITSCSSGGGGGSGSGDSSSSCDGGCARQALSDIEVRQILSQGTSAALSLTQNATIAITDRVGNVLAVYQMPGASLTTTITGKSGASGGLENLSVPSSLAAISKAGTGAYLSSQGNAFSTRTASQIIQEHFNPGQRNQPGGPLFGVQFSQLPCSDVKDRVLGPRPLPLGLSADPGGIPLYKNGDLVGGIGVELDGEYTIDREIEDSEDNIEERIALIAAKGFDTPQNIRAERITVGGQSLRFVDINQGDVDNSFSLLEITPIDDSNLIHLSPFTNGSIRSGATFGDSGSGVADSVRIGVASANLTTGGGGPRFPTRSGSLTGPEVDALLDSALLTASRTRAAIRRPLSTSARVSIFVVDTNGIPLGFTRSQDAPVFGIDVSLQKARTAAFFSSPDANQLLISAGLGGYVAKTSSLFPGAFDGSHAFTARAIGNISRPFFPDGIDGNAEGPLSIPFPGSWSPFNTGLQLDLVLAGVAAPLSGSIPNLCTSSVFGRRIGNGIQIFSGSVPLYRDGVLVGGLGISGDGIFQDDLIAFYGASREGLNFAGHTDIGNPVLGFNAPPEIRSDTIDLGNDESRLRYVNCPESAFLDSGDQNVCASF